ncbi:hypothetical protein [Paraburkholderia sp. JPY419]|uniref:hypothetical protein n=1 Tax=Paraburkholderia sp. JPY419 TaxID=667660 RepID=UPI003D1B610D
MIVDIILTALAERQVRPLRPETAVTAAWLAEHTRLPTATVRRYLRALIDSGAIDECRLPSRIVGITLNEQGLELLGRTSRDENQ